MGVVLVAIPLAPFTAMQIITGRGVRGCTAGDQPTGHRHLTLYGNGM
jgi:hypothetical protein